jgi:hypothetical protein
MKKERELYKILLAKPKRKIPLGRPRRRWEDGSEWILGRLAGGEGGFNRLKIGTSSRILRKVMNLQVLAHIVS